MAFKVAVTCVPKASAWEKEALIGGGAEVLTAICTTEASVLDLAREADAILAGTVEPFSRQVIGQLRHCRVIARYGVGLDNVDVAAATDHGICVAYVPDASVDEVSDHALALILACARKLVAQNNGVKAGKWAVGRLELAIQRRPMFKLRGQVLGIVGLGRIGRATAPKAQGFGMRVIAYDPYLDPALAHSLGVELVDFDRLLGEADFVSIHAPLTEETEGLFGSEELQKMKCTAYLINTARGPIVDEAALAEACSTGVIAGAGVDVLATEPPGESSPLFALDNVVISAHSAYYSESANLDIRRRPLEDVLRVLRGELPLGLVNPEVVDKLTWVKR